jgi:hypothetical protein
LNNGWYSLINWLAAEYILDYPVIRLLTLDAECDMAEVLYNMIHL